MTREQDPDVRALPAWARVGSVAVRAGHIVGCSVVLGAALLGVGPGPRLGPWWALAGATGLLLLAYEVAAHRAYWRLLGGWATGGKLVLLALARAVPSLAAPTLVVAAVVSVLGAHLPRRWRHRRMW